MITSACLQLLLFHFLIIIQMIFRLDFYTKDAKVDMYVCLMGIAKDRNVERVDCLLIVCVLGWFIMSLFQFE